MGQPLNLNDDHSLYLQLKEGNEQAFKALFEKYYASMCHYACQFLKDTDLAEETVQELFVRLWEKRTGLTIDTSVNNYLFRSVHNHCLNQLQHQKIRQQYASHVMEVSKQEADWQPFYMEVELMERIEKCISALPEKRQEIFRLSREQGLKYKEIAEKLNISVKTVEAQMGLALKYLRDELKELNPSQLALLIILKKKIILQ
jgi:RNA polymerase sigma-70 factor (ECF subfamily)